MFLALALAMAAPPSLTYAEARTIAACGMPVVVYAGVPLPTKAEANAVRVDAIPGTPAGVYLLTREGGKVMLESKEKPVSVARVYTDRVGWHRHKCESCGSIWEHPNGTNSDGHYCPGCGQYEDDKYKGGSAPVTIKKAKPSGKPKRIFDGRYYWDEYPDGTRVWCTECNRGR